MTDKEVGDIWREACHVGATNPAHFWRVKDLIRKLVEERQLKLLYLDYPGGIFSDTPAKESLRIALLQFGITEAEWKDEG